MQPDKRRESACPNMVGSPGDKYNINGSLEQQLVVRISESSSGVVIENRVKYSQGG
jgi:hypothetical protein